ncbi:hypothetical protein [Taklimakanibacter albus]|uniref:Uncharacterized protein n=1 Tax=Taklimakanibacter albus TaxID=2800327 RepID=A0ACC5RAK2_9HYPH|nr:hypothetical protein [Aestuariivirga sp. YIM B02566]MBK1869699.1 hypothetical protein [Aestuariivirga sp. YIM B02566]
MTNFADRLIARGAGQPAGLPLLKARPAARFEQEMVPTVDAATPDEQQFEKPAQSPAVSRKTNPAPAKATRQAHSDESALPNENVKADGDRPLPASEPLSSPPRSSPPAMIASQQDFEMLEQSDAPGSEPAASRPPSFEHPEVPHHQRPMFFDVPPMAPIVTAATPVESAPSPPTISIGRIDVQFLPQERPAAPARPQPQRTRGFDSYARARRGEPR